jgi:hypothetical protein
VTIFVRGVVHRIIRHATARKRRPQVAQGRPDICDSEIAQEKSEK